MVRGSPNPRHLGLPARLRKARKESGMARKALADKAGRDSKVAALIEDGQRLPTVGTIARLASVMGVSAGWLGYGLGDSRIDGPAATTDGMGARLAALRGEQEHTKASLGKATGLNPGTIGGIERGGQAGIATVEALAQALNVSPAWLAFNQGPRELPKKRRASKVPAASHPER